MSWKKNKTKCVKHFQQSWHNIMSLFIKNTKASVSSTSNNY